MDSTDHSSGTPFRPKTTNTGNTGRISMADNSSIGLSQRNIRASPYSPFPFGLPIQSSSRSILSPGSVEQKILENEEIAGRNSFPNESIKNHTSPHVLRGRVRAQDVYGGPLMFGGSRAYSTNRGGVIQSSGKSRNQRLLLSASPYHCAAASRIAGKQFGRQRPSNSSSTTPSPSGSSTSSAPGGLSNNTSQTANCVGPNRPSNFSPANPLQHSPHFIADPNSSNSSYCSRPSSSLASHSTKTANASTTNPECISSTARLILDTLDKMSTPIRDAQKLSSVLSNNSLQHETAGLNTSGRSSRAERRKLIAEALDASSVSMNLSNSSLSMQDDLISNHNDKSGRAKRRRPNLGAPLNGNASNASRLRANNSYFNGPPLRSLAFSPVSKDKASAQASLKSARIQNLNETSVNSSGPPGSWSTTINANDSKKSSQIENINVTKPLAANKSTPFNALSSDPMRLSTFSNKPENNISSFGNNKNSDSGSNPSIPAIAAKQGGKMKTKISSGLNQVRAQRSGANSNNELSFESSSNENELQNTKSLSMFFNSSKSDTEKSMKLPDINFSSSNNIKSIIEKKTSDTAMPIKPLGTEFSLLPNDDKKNVSYKTGAYEAIKTSPTSLSSDSLSTKNVATVGNIIPSDTNVSTSKSIKSSETQNFSSNSSLTKTFSFTPAFDLKQSTMLPTKDDTSRSSRKFTFDSPIQQTEFHTDKDKAASGNTKLSNENQGKPFSNVSSISIGSFGQDGPLPDLTNNVYNNRNNAASLSFKSNGPSALSTLPSHDKTTKSPNMFGSPNFNSPSVKPSVISNPAFGTEIGGRSTFSANIFSAGTNAGNPGQLQHKSLMENFNMTSSSKIRSPSSNNLSPVPGAIPKVGQLLSGSVMDILKGKSPQQKMPNQQAESQPWDTKFKQNDKPWNFS